MDRSLTPKEFFNEEEQSKVMQAVAEAEKMTSGEIRVHIERNSGQDPLKKAREVFVRIGMRETELRNGVLFFLTTEDKTFTILGDDNINKQVPEDFWETTKDTVLNNFKQAEFVQGLVEGIKLAGQQLATFFPYQSDDVNELSDQISFGE